jgi:hypothetical protein
MSKKSKTGPGETELTDAEAAVEALGSGSDRHVITLRGADGFELLHPAGGCPEGCAVGEAAGRISRAMCETLGQWTCEVAGGVLMLVERVGD